MGKELFGAFLVRMFDHLVGRAFLDHHAAIHKQDAVCHIARKRHFVRDNDHGSFLVGQIAQNTQNFAGQLRVKGAGWFIKAKDIRFQRQGAGNSYTLLLAAGKLVRVMVSRSERPICARRVRAFSSSSA